jgi:hypothetical protein
MDESYSKKEQEINHAFFFENHSLINLVVNNPVSV